MIGEYKLNILKKNLLSNYRTSLNSLVHIGLLTHKEAQGFIIAIDEKIYLKEKVLIQIKELKEREEFKKNNPLLVRDWETYKKIQQLQNGLDLSESFFNWLGHIKNIDWRKYEKEGLK